LYFASRRLTFCLRLGYHSLLEVRRCAGHGSTAGHYAATPLSIGLAACASGTKLESDERYLGIDVDDALEIAEQTEV
jgi:hypothetical protein